MTEIYPEPQTRCSTIGYLIPQVLYLFKESINIGKSFNTFSALPLMVQLTLASSS